MTRVRGASRFVGGENVDTSRVTAVRRLRAQLLQSSWPRAQMLLIVGLTTGAGLLSSWLLLFGGMTAMGPRYAISVALAYLVFLLLLWVWLRSDSSDYQIDIPSPPSSSSSQSSASCRPGSEAATTPRSSFDSTSSSSDGLGQALGDVGMGDVLGASDEAAIPLILVVILLALLAGVFVVIGSVVWSAPALFAELLFDGVLAAGLYRRMRLGDAQHWLQTALRHTFFPFLLTLVLVAGAGFAIQHFHPEAVTLSQGLG